MKKFFKSFLHYLAYPFVLINFGWSILRIKAKAKKYVKDPTSITIDVRYKKVYRICKRVLFLKNINIEVENFDDLPKSAKLFVGNHKSNLDPIIMVKILYEKTPDQYFTFVAKKELAKNKWIKAAIDLIDGIYIDRQDPRKIFEVLDKQKEFLNKNKSIVIFPEGTRVNSDTIGEFKSGAIKIAYDCFVPIVPFAIYGSTGRLDHDKTNKKKGTIAVMANNTIRPNTFITVNVIQLSTRLQALVSASYGLLQNKYGKKEKK